MLELFRSGSVPLTELVPLTEFVSLAGRTKDGHPEGIGRGVETEDGTTLDEGTGKETDEGTVS